MRKMIRLHNQLIYRMLANVLEMVSNSMEIGCQKHGDWTAKTWRLDGKSMEIEIHPPCAG